MAKPTRVKPADLPDGTPRRLAFFRCFLNAIGKDREAVAAAAGVTMVTVSYWWRNDNARLDQLMDIADAFGYRLEVRLSGDGSPARVEVKDLDTDDDGRYVLKRMSFLSFALRQCGITKTELAARLGVSVYTVQAWYKSDTINLDRIYDVARVTGCDVNFTISPKEGDGARTRGSLKSTYDIALHGGFEFQP